MIIPDGNGLFHCQGDKFTTSDIFIMLDHYGVEYEWNLRMSKKYSLDMFKFLKILQELIHAHELDEALDHVQSAALLLSNSSVDSLDEFIEEVQVRSNLGDMFLELEEILREDSE